jgi:hypothetical protein
LTQEWRPKRLHPFKQLLIHYARSLYLCLKHPILSDSVLTINYGRVSCSNVAIGKYNVQALNLSKQAPYRAA